MILRQWTFIANLFAAQIDSVQTALRELQYETMQEICSSMFEGLEGWGTTYVNFKHGLHMF